MRGTADFPSRNGRSSGRFATNFPSRPGSGSSRRARPEAVSTFSRRTGAESSGGTEPIAILGPGAILGEMSLFNENVRTSEVRALEATTLAVHSLAAVSFTRCLRQEPATVRLMERLGQLMVQRLHAQEAALFGRIAATRCSLWRRLDEFADVRKRLLADWALKYHSLGRAGKLAIVRLKAGRDRGRSLGRLLSRCRAAVPRHRRETGRRLRLHQPRAPRRRRHQRYRRSRSGEHRRGGGEAGDGRQGRLFQTVRGPGRVRHRGR